jgi:hypothetical protein
MKPQSRKHSGTQRDSLCSPKEYSLMEITEGLYPVYSIEWVSELSFFEELNEAGESW